jgi:hypothetical protein
LHSAREIFGGKYGPGDTGTRRGGGREGPRIKFPELRKEIGNIFCKEKYCTVN